MRTLRLSFFASALFLILSAHTCNKTTSVGPTTALSSRWDLQSLAGRSLQLAAGTATPYVEMDPKTGSLSGFAGCNNLMGKVKLEGEALSFPGLGGTKKMCAENMDVENGFMSALRNTTGFQLNGDRLTLLGKGAELATLVRGK